MMQGYLDYYTFDYSHVEILSAIMADMDPTSSGVKFTAFKRWLGARPKEGLNFEGELLLAELRTKANRWILTNIFDL